MGRMIVKQNNSKYAVFSSIVDDLILVGATPEQIVDFYIKDSIETFTEMVHRQIDRNQMLDLDICLKSINKNNRIKAAELLMSESYQEL